MRLKISYHIRVGQALARTCIFVFVLYGGIVIVVSFIEHSYLGNIGVALMQEGVEGLDGTSLPLFFSLISSLFGIRLMHIFLRKLLFIESLFFCKMLTSLESFKVLLILSFDSIFGSIAS